MSLRSQILVGSSNPDGVIRLEAALAPDGSITVVVEGLKPNAPYEYRAKVKVGDQSFYGRELKLQVTK